MPATRHPAPIRVHLHPGALLAAAAMAEVHNPVSRKLAADLRRAADEAFAQQPAQPTTDRGKQ